jgi:hypothetical protein
MSTPALTANEAVLDVRWKVYDTEGRLARMIKTEATGVFVGDMISPEVAVAIVNQHNDSLRLGGPIG